MKIAIYGKVFNQGFKPYIREIMGILREQQAQLVAYAPFDDFIRCETGDGLESDRLFTCPEDFDPTCDLMISIGGDGTFLESIPYVLKSQIPIIGINSGRLGFLANISKENIADAFRAIFANNYGFEYRSLICFRQPEGLFNGLNFALNDITLHKSNSSLITIDAYINDDFLNTYWTDGLIISTPTGSTAYSLSVGGPVVVPGSGNLIIAPISSHNLTVRPLIIPDSNLISLKVKSRSGSYTVTADNRTMQMDSQDTAFVIGKSDFKLKMLKLPGSSFYSTLRNKLKWGEDIRN